jgi:adenylate kinase family enzyme
MIKVYVVGTTNSGKSTISALINDVLQEYGIETELFEAVPGESEPASMDELLDRGREIGRNQRLNGERTEIHEVQAMRNGAFNVSN